MRSYKLGEADLILVLLTRSHGVVRAVAKGVRRTTSRWGSRLEPFTHVDLQLALARGPGRRGVGRLEPGGQPEVVAQVAEPVAA